MLCPSFCSVRRPLRSQQKDKAIDFLVGMGSKQENALAVAEPIGRAATAYRAATEDLARATYWFCKRWAETGGRIWLAPWMKMQHIGEHAFGGDGVEASEAAWRAAGLA